MIQYPKNTHLTLPSVEGAFGSMNILRDPSKSIHTRYIEKVGATSLITDWIGDSGCRVNEVIKQYPRGVNPMASGSMSNAGTNGGQVRYRAGSFSQNNAGLSHKEAYLPYRIMQGGAFRPPITPPELLLPLSRQPHVLTPFQTNPGSEQSVFNNLNKCNVDLRAIRSELLDVTQRPTAIFNIRTPVQPNRDDIVKSIIESPLQVSAQSKQSRSIQNVAQQPYNVRESINNKRMIAATTNKNGKKVYDLNRNGAPDRGVNRDRRYSAVPSKAFKNLGVPIAGYLGNQPINVKTINQINRQSNTSGIERQTYLHNDIVLDKKLAPVCHTANLCQQGVDVNSSLSSRTYTNLPERRSRGGFENQGLKTSTLR